MENEKYHRSEISQLSSPQKKDLILKKNKEHNITGQNRTEKKRTKQKSEKKEFFTKKKKAESVIIFKNPSFSTY